MTNFDQYRDYSKKASELEQTLRAYNASNDPKVKVQSRQVLEQIINTEVPQANVTNNTSDNIINQLGTNIQARYETFALDEFKKSPNDAITKAKSKYNEQFEEKALGVIPYEIKGNEAHNKIAKLHKNTAELGLAINAFRRDQKSMPYDQFIGQTVKYIQEAVKEHLGKDPTNLADLIASIYITSNPNEALAIASLTYNTMQEKLDKLIPKEQRADYAEKTLRAKASSEKDEEIAEASKNLYALIAA